MPVTGKYILWLLLLSGLYSSLTVQSYAQYTTNGNATQILCRYHELTPAAFPATGTVWNNNQINLANSFDFSFNIFLGCDPAAGNGIAFVLQNTGTAIIGAGDDSLGYGGITQSLIVEVDSKTDAAANDPAFNHIGILRDGNPDHVSGFGATGALPGNADIADCNWHLLRITWDPATQTMRTYINGVLKLTLTNDIITNIFGGSSMVYWGFTGSTSAASNIQQFSSTLLPGFTISPASACFNDSITFSDTSYSSLDSIITRSWDFGDAGISTAQNPKHAYSAPGTYSVTLTVTDISGCDTSKIIPVTITGPPNLSATGANLKCKSDCAGTAIVTATGSLAPYTYKWNDPASQTNDTASGLCAGLYSVTVTDANGCDSIQSITLTEPADTLKPSISSVVNVKCNGVCDGQAAVAVTGGVGPIYTYLWNDPATQTTATATGLCNGNFNVTVTDAVGCDSIISVTITEPPLLTATSAINSVSCGGACDGSATISASGGSGSYTYLWDDVASQTTQTAVSLCIGSYNVTVTDSLACDTIVQVNIVSSPKFTASVAYTIAPTCPDDCNGSTKISTSSGTTPYTFTWNDPGSQIDSIAGALCSGSFSVYIKDAANCDTTITVNVTKTPFSITPAITNISCNGNCDGQVSLSVSGANGPGYTYLWNDPASQTTATAGGLCAGVYNVTISDPDGCDTIFAATITEPGIFTVTATGTNVKCNGACDGLADASTNGGTSPFTYLWNDAGSQTVISATGLCPGSYSVSVTDAGGCTASSSVTITEPVQLTAQITSANSVSCFGGNDGSATITPTMGTGTMPYSYLWAPSGGNNSNASTLTAGNYEASVIDANGCITTEQITINEPKPMAASTASTQIACGKDTGSAAVSVIEGTIPYTYLWSDANAQTTVTATGLNEGNYAVLVTDANNCIVQGQITLTKIVCDIIILNTFTPNDDEFNDTWEIKNLSVYPDSKVEVYNRWGDIVFTSVGYLEAWDGKGPGGTPVPSAAYYYIITIKSIDFTKAGAVSVIR